MVHVDTLVENLISITEFYVSKCSMFQVAIFVRTMIMDSEEATEQLEVVMEAFYPLYLPPYNYTLGQTAYPNTTKMNTR